MNFFLKIVVSAGVAGMLAAVILTALQTTKVYPLILAAEVYETDAKQGDKVSSHQHGKQGSSVDKHEHAGDAWAPEDGVERLIFSFISNALASVGLALVLVAIFAWRNISNWRHGLIWGTAGFVAVQLAPALGLPPELPGMPAGDLLARQAWWAGTVGATAMALAAICLGRNMAVRIFGILLLAAPHIIGAPHPVEITSLVPATLAAEFVSASLATNLVFWAALGLLSAVVLKQFDRKEDAAVA